jgi:phosphoglycolate phosphatase-like HAD superfamily hydrolase
VSHVLFWDIDGTLLTTARAGVFALEDAAREVCGAQPDFQALNTAGLTDAEVAGLAIESCGGEASEELVEAFLRAYERRLPDSLHRRKGRVMPGIVAVLDYLAERRDDVTSLLLTGNTEAGARAKLAHYGLDGYFDGGAFCIDSAGRESIARRARQLAEERLGELSGDRLYVIGDTPHDIRVGKAIGARTVALGTGPVPLGQLLACEPWLAFEQLPTPERFAEELGLQASH